jgi:uncharacterized protein YoxC
MKKQLAFTVIGVLAVALVAVVVLLILNNNSLNNKIADRDNTISGLETDLSTSQAEAADLSARLTASEAEVANLETQNAQLNTDLQAANSKISDLEGSLATAQDLNTTLGDELEQITYPRHFTSLSELTDWLAQDDTDTKYASMSSYIQQSYILQIRALRDGYILSTDLFFTTVDSYWISNFAIIGNTMYMVEASDDSVTEYATFFLTQPSRPIPLP